MPRHRLCPLRQQRESFLGARARAVAQGVASFSDQGEEAGAMRLDNLGSSGLRCCELGQPNETYTQPPTGKEVESRPGRRVAACADRGQSHPGAVFGKIAAGTPDAEAPLLVFVFFFFLEVFLTAILTSWCFLGVFLFFLQNGYKNLGKQTNKKQDQQSQTRVK